MKRKISPTCRSSRGLSLIELMIAITLGVLITAATLSIFSTNKQSYRATENLGRVQESGRTAFELMSRDIREAGGNPCANNIPVANTLNNAATTWWSNWTNGVLGYENGALAGSTAGTDAIELHSGMGTGATVVTHNPTSATLDVRPLAHGFLADDILLVCDFTQAAIFQMSGPAANPVTNGNIGHNTGAGAPGNCSKGLGFAVPMVCGNPGTAYAYGENSQVVRMQASRWFVNNGTLFRQSLRNNGTTPAEEVINGVLDMEITYLLPGAAAYVAATAVPAPRWREVTAVRVELMLQSEDAVGTGNQRLQRPIVQTINLRNRTP
jgi:type IV pilus assembly protein PilW